MYNKIVANERLATAKINEEGLLGLLVSKIHTLN
jgi:hypothetical protein